MRITKPTYFDTFRCIAGDCPDSCCKEWDVQVDEATAAQYRALPGALGDRLRQVLKDEDGETVMTIVEGRCPMWRADSLCRIQAELGHDALCKTCREFPRLTHDYGSFRELGLELSCPEAARIILSTPTPTYITTEVPGGEYPEYDAEAMAVLLRTRDEVRTILSTTTVLWAKSLLWYCFMAIRPSRSWTVLRLPPLIPMQPLRKRNNLPPQVTRKPFWIFSRNWRS